MPGLVAWTIGVAALALGSIGCIADVDDPEVDESLVEAGDELEVDVAQDATHDPVGDGPSHGDEVADPEPDPWAPKPPTWYTDPEPDPWDPWGAPERAIEADQAHQS